MKTIKLISSVVILLSMLCIACSDDSAFVSTEELMEQKFEEVTGTAFLKISNECSNCSNVYFEGKLIGMVDIGCCGMWSVPEGTHVVKVFGEYNGNCGGTLEFKEGEITFVCITPDDEIDVILNYEKPKGDLNYEDLNEK